jgi:hypothetical protein
MGNKNPLVYDDDGRETELILDRELAKQIGSMIASMSVDAAKHIAVAKLNPGFDLDKAPPFMTAHGDPEENRLFFLGVSTATSVLMHAIKIQFGVSVANQIAETVLKTEVRIATPEQAKGML